MPEPIESLTWALPKGRILRQAAPLLREIGLELESVLADPGRKLMFELPATAANGAHIVHKVLLVKPSDVPTYVDYGIADLGIAGRDTLEEQGRDLYEPVDLKIGACRLATAEPIDRKAVLHRGMQLRVATKYPQLARRHYRAKGIFPEIIALYGSVELGALTGLADHIVDLVESGETLRQNRLREIETIMPVTSRLVVHPASLKLKADAISPIIETLRVAVTRAAEG